MGSSASSLRGVAAAAMEGSSLGRCVFSSSRMPTARAYVVKEAVGLRGLGIFGGDPQPMRRDGDGDGDASRPRKLLLLGVGKGSEAEIPPSPRASFFELPLLARYAMSPTARPLMVTDAAGLRGVGIFGGDPQPMRRDIDGGAPSPHELLLLGVGEGSEAEIPPSPRASFFELPLLARYAMSPRVGALRAWGLSLLVGDEGSEDILPPSRPLIAAGTPNLCRLVGDEGSEQVLPRARHLMAPRPHQLTILAAVEASVDSYVDAPRPHHRSLLARRPSALSLAAGAASASSIAGGARPCFFTRAICTGARPRTSLPAICTGPRPRFFLPAICTGNVHLFRPACGGYMRIVELPLIQFQQRRSWCWTPWQPNPPKAPEPKEQGLQDIIKLLKEVKLSKEEQKMLKDFCLEMFYAEEDPQDSHVKLDLLLARQGLTNHILMLLYGKNEKKPKRWLSFTVRGRKVDLGNWLLTFISLFFK